MEKSFKNIIVVDIDTDRKDATVMMGKPPEFKKDLTKEEFAQEIINDMATLCEGVCTLIHLAEKEGIKTSSDSLRDCINHLQDGFADASFKGFKHEDWETIHKPKK